MIRRALVCLALLSAPSVAIAAPKPVVKAASAVVVTQAWIREAPPGMDMLAAYVTIVNHRRTPVVLTGVASPLFASVMMHESVHHGDQVSMRMLDHVAIAPGGTYRFSPGASHLMLMGPRHALKPGEQVPLIFHFQGFDAGATAIVKKP